ncbi:inositol monophosphatase [Thalassospira sp. TSL5-1]|uniref:inositol monophosphatase family protein n=1 Tax=Thalassospira sp. TSL5-1 TaxID=1544451 RepID=UPI00093F9D97|nr:inositol monophosphatase [Thalassospira sp. TSL5-1]OKH89950.1 inositol monophosphatase [Thalassospira sp. TSL5-1]
MTPDIDKVTTIIREVAAEEIAPRFGQLEAGDIDTKTHAQDLVTIADTEAERILTRRLTALLPGSVALGEEAAHHDASLQKTVFAGTAPIWIIDPVDGTKNFAHQRQPFRSMLALYQDGRTVAAWIVDPLTGDVTVAEHGSGTFHNGMPVKVRSEIMSASSARGFLIFYVRNRLAKAYGKRHFFEKLSYYSCCGAEYQDVALGNYDFCVYRTLKPWDHAPGTLLVREAGGIARYFSKDGQKDDYHANGSGAALICASSPELWDEINQLLQPVWQ